METLGGGGGGSDPNPIFFSQNFLFFLETTKLASSYFKTCVTVKIWLNLMHTNLIARLIHATVPVPGGGEGVILGDFFFIWRPKKILLMAIPK